LLAVYLGTLGMTGMIAWVGLNLVEVKADDFILFRQPPALWEVWPGN
jgi:NADPH-dependent curcumin reductase CurA